MFFSKYVVIPFFFQAFSKEKKYMEIPPKAQKPLLVYQTSTCVAISGHLSEQRTFFFLHIFGNFLFTKFLNVFALKEFVLARPHIIVIFIFKAQGTSFFQVLQKE